MGISRAAFRGRMTECCRSVPRTIRPLDFLHAQEGHEFLPYEGIYAAALFGGLMIRMGTITGARGGEIQQIAQSPDCFKQLDNVGPKAATRWLLRMVPKGRKERADYYIDEDTKSHLVELIRFQCEKTGDGPLFPVVQMEYGKTPPDRYVLQWNGRGFDLQVLNTSFDSSSMGLLFRSLDGTWFSCQFHLLRHAFATEMAELEVAVDIIARLLHQRDITVTKYYSRPTPTQVMSAAEMIFVDRIDRRRRSAAKPGRDRTNAERGGRQGWGSHRSVWRDMRRCEHVPRQIRLCGLCWQRARPRQALPDPAEAGLGEATGTVTQSGRSSLRKKGQLKQLIADCKLVMEEMDLIEAMRKDAAQIVSIQHGSRR